MSVEETNNSRVDHWASIRDRSIKPLQQTVTPSVPGLDALKQQVLEKEAQIERLCAEIEAMQVPLGGFAGKRIARAVAKAHGVSFNDLVSHRREHHLVRARQHAMWELAQHTKLSYPQIGRILGDRDHSTVIHGIKRHALRIAGEIE